MAYQGRNPNWNTGTFSSLSADPTAPTEGTTFYSDGTSREEGLWTYKNGEFVRLAVLNEIELVSIQNADYTVLDDDNFTTIISTDTSSLRTITLPDAASNTNRVLRFINTSSDSVGMLIQRAGTDTMGGGVYTALNLDFRDSYLILQSTGSNWAIIDSSFNKPTNVFTLTATATNWTTVNAEAFGIKDYNGEWVIHINIEGTTSASASFISPLTIAGITFKTGFTQAATLYVGGNTATQARANGGASTMLLERASSGTVWKVNGVFSLNARPSSALLV